MWNLRLFWYFCCPQGASSILWLDLYEVFDSKTGLELYDAIKKKIISKNAKISLNKKSDSIQEVY